MIKVKALKGALDWFSSDNPITIGNIYDFPNITFDNGKMLRLHPDLKHWVKEFEIIEEFKEIIYELY